MTRATTRTDRRHTKVGRLATCSEFSHRFLYSGVTTEPRTRRHQPPRERHPSSLGQAGHDAKVYEEELVSRYGRAPMRLLTIAFVVGFTLVVAAQPPADLSRQSAGGAAADLSRQSTGGAAADLSRQSTAGAAADWPQWQGPDRTGLSKETGLLQQWPPSGPPAVWSISGLGAGYGSVAVKGDHLFVQAMSAAERTSTVASLNRADGKVVWRRSVGRS